jgi:arginine:ornithine antiporter/lysine permease
VPYVLSGAYAFKLALNGESHGAGEGRGRDMFTGALASIYGGWLIDAAGPNDLLMCAILSTAGVPVFLGTGGECHGGGQRPYDGQA